MKEAGSDQSPEIFSVLPQIRLSVFSAMPLVTCLRLFIFVLCFSFLVNLCSPVLLFSHVIIRVLFLLSILDMANEETNFKERLCFSWILKPDQWFNPLKVLKGVKFPVTCKAIWKCLLVLLGAAFCPVQQTLHVCRCWGFGFFTGSIHEVLEW